MCNESPFMVEKISPCARGSNSGPGKDVAIIILITIIIIVSTVTFSDR